MTNIIQDLAGADLMTEKDIVAELLLCTKNTIKHYASALAETATPQVRDTFKRHLNDAIASHEEITNYALEKGYYHPFNLTEQFKDDLKDAFLALDLETWKQPNLERTQTAIGVGP